MSEAKEYPTSVVLSAVSGVLLCEFGAMHELAEFALGGPVWTHEFAASSWASKQLSAGLLAQHPTLAQFNLDGVNRDNWREYVVAAEKAFGPSLTVWPIPDAGRNADPMTTLGEIFEPRAEG